MAIPDGAFDHLEILDLDNLSIRYWFHPLPQAR